MEIFNEEEQEKINAFFNSNNREFMENNSRFIVEIFGKNGGIDSQKFVNFISLSLGNIIANFLQSMNGNGVEAKIYMTVLQRSILAGLLEFVTNKRDEEGSCDCEDCKKAIEEFKKLH